MQTLFNFQIASRTPYSKAYNSPAPPSGRILIENPIP